jgi:hypothetical protein
MGVELRSQFDFGEICDRFLGGDRSLMWGICDRVLCDELRSQLGNMRSHLWVVRVRSQFGSCEVVTNSKSLISTQKDYYRENISVLCT